METNAPNKYKIIFKELDHIKENEPYYFMTESERLENEEIQQLRQIVEDAQRPSWTRYTST